jgi:hypothetical protein
MTWRFEDYTLDLGHTNVGRVPYAALREFFALVGTGATHDEAITELRRLFGDRVQTMRRAGEPLPTPGERPRAQFAPNDRIEALRPFVDEFWRNVLGTSYLSSYVSDESMLDAWEHYAGGRGAVITRVLERYGVDISAFYNEPLPAVLARIRDAAI